MHLVKRSFTNVAYSSISYGPQSAMDMKVKAVTS